MSLSSALSNAVSGLSAASKRTETISDNLANAMTEGYAAREVGLSARVSGRQGAGVEIDGVLRRADPRATADRRGAEAWRSGASVRADAAARLAEAVGAPGAAGSLPARALAFENAVARLAETPESGPLQADAAAAAGGLADALNEASETTQRLRMEADAAIGGMVGEINEALAAVEDLNGQIRRETIAGRPAAALEEQRARQVDRLSGLVPMRIAERPHGAIALYTPGGGVLLDGRAAEVSFSTTALITPDMTLASGALGALRIDGKAVAAGTGDGPLDGGALGARFAVRDSLAPEAQAQLDAIAADLMARFEAPGPDPTLAPGDPGLFTDAGAALDPAATTGLAGRLQLNAAVDPAQGGEVRRMRDGVNSAASGPAGEDDLPRAMMDALSALSPAPAGSGLSGAVSFSGLAEGVSALRLQAEGESERASAFAQGRFATLREAESAATGVDSDEQMSDLLVVEQSYAANARVIQVADGLLRRLLEI
ncbi:MAG: flagellar hook-associated protein FlgK [Pseudomonadota bacterium]